MMMRTALQAALWLWLLPLPAAQQGAPTAAAPDTAAAQPPLPVSAVIPKDTKIELVSLEQVSSETAARSLRVRFAVANDVVVNRMIVVPAGTTATGIVTKVKRGIPNHQWAELRIHMEDVKVGEGLRLRLSPWVPAARHIDPGLVATCIALPILCLALKNLGDNGWGEDGPPKPDAEAGQQAVLPACVSFDFWVTSAKTIAATDSPLDDSGSTTLLNVACPKLQEGSRTNEDPELFRVLFR